MAFKLRRRLRLVPGIMFNISRRGISTTLGIKGLSVNVGKKGAYLNTGIPGTGIYDRKKISGRQNSHHTRFSDDSIVSTQFNQQHIKQPKYRTNFVEVFLWLISLLWLGLWFVMFQEATGFGVLLVIVLAIMPFVIYWFWKKRHNNKIKVECIQDDIQQKSDEDT